MLTGKKTKQTCKFVKFYSNIHSQFTNLTPNGNIRFLKRRLLFSLQHTLTELFMEWFKCNQKIISGGGGAESGMCSSYSSSFESSVCVSGDVKSNNAKNGKEGKTR